MRGGEWKRNEGVPLIQWCALALPVAVLLYLVIHWIGG